MLKGVVLGSSALLLAALLVIALRPAPTDVPRQPPLPGEPVPLAEIQERRGALVDEVVFTREMDIGRAPGLIEAGSHQVFIQPISSTTVFNRLRDSLHTAYSLAYGTSSELTLNPTGPLLDNGTLNPFHVPAIREALNRLIDRRHVAEEIFGGLAVPRYLPINTAFPDYARLADVARALELRYSHDPDAAAEVIEQEMVQLGAEMRNGRWHYEGRPVRIIVLIRTEDERRRVGDYIANLLENVGFQVERRYRTGDEASRIWIATDPRAGQWHVYTGGWISTVISRDQAENFSYYYTPRGRTEPLWQGYEPVAEFDELADRLQRRDYHTQKERDTMMARALELALQDSSRVWLVDQLNASARAANVELAADLAGGLSGSWLWPYTLRYTDRLGGRMVMGSPGLLTEPWNPVAGSNWINDQMMIRATDDPAVLPDPFTGLYWPQRISRAEVTVQEGVPVARTLDWLTLDTADEIPVPEDAWVDWDARAGRFVSVAERYPEGTSARTRVRIHYDEDLFERYWHDGSRLSINDILLPWILSYDRAKPESPLYDVAHLPVFEAYQRHFRGFQMVSYSPLVIDVYSNQIYPDAETIVAARAPSPQPWHTLALGILAEQNGELAFSSNKADRQRVDWMSFVAGPSIGILERLMQQVQEQGLHLYPQVLDPYLSQDEIATRFEALSDWYRERGHFWVGSGPFYLHSLHPLEGSLVLRRFESYRDPADKWLRFARAEIPELTLTGPAVVESGSGAQFSLSITFDGVAYDRAAIRDVQYLLFDGAMQLVERGTAEWLEDDRWQVRLDAATVRQLGVGANSLELVVASDRVALPTFASHVFASIPAPGSLAEPAAMPTSDGEAL